MMRGKDDGAASGDKSNVYGVASSEADGGRAAPSAEKLKAARQRLIEAMIQPRSCYMESLDYAVRDPEFLDAVLKKLLGRATLAEVADDDREMKNLIREAPDIYAAELQTEDGIARLQKVLAQRFAQPVVRSSGKIIEADYGHVAAKLFVGRRKTITIDFDASPHLVNREWRSTEVAAALKDQLDKHPDAEGVELRVLIPEALLGSEWRYTYRRSIDRVIITFPGAPRRPYMTPVLGHDLSPYIRGEKSLATQDLQVVNPSVMQQMGGSEPPPRQ
jgi:hypothetical protein